MKIRNDDYYLLHLCHVINHVYFQLCIHIKHLTTDEQKKILGIYHEIFILLKIFNETKSNIIITYFLCNSIKIIENKLLEFKLVDKYFAFSLKILFNAVIEYKENYIKLCEIMNENELMISCKVSICPNIQKSIIHSRISLFPNSNYYYEYNWNNHFYNYLYTEWRNYLTCERIEKLDIYPSVNGELTKCDYCQKTDICCKLLLVDKDTCFLCSRKLWLNNSYLRMRDVLLKTEKLDKNNEYTLFLRKRWGFKKLVYKNWNNYFTNNIKTIIELVIIPSKTPFNTCFGCNNLRQCCKFFKLKIPESYYCLQCTEKIFN